MGIGIGGDYPISAVVASEFAPSYCRGRHMTAVFSAQGFGNFAASLVSFIVVEALKNKIVNDPVNTPVHVDDCWRVLIGLGCVPGVVALYFRLTIPETPRFTMDVENNLDQASQDVEMFLASGTHVVDRDAVVKRIQAPKASRQDFLKYFSRWRNFKVLLGAGYSWFALDIGKRWTLSVVLLSEASSLLAYYGLGLNASIYLEAIGFNSSPQDKDATPSELIFITLKNISIGNLILSVAGLIPGYWVAFLFIDSWGRKPIQLMGFSVLAVIFCIMARRRWQSQRNCQPTYTFFTHRALAIMQCFTTAQPPLSVCTVWPTSSRTLARTRRLSSSRGRCSQLGTAQRRTVSALRAASWEPSLRK